MREELLFDDSFFLYIDSCLMAVRFPANRFFMTKPESYSTIIVFSQLPS